MTEPIFGKKGNKPKDAQPAQPQQQVAPTNDFWSNESHKPDTAPEPQASAPIAAEQNITEAAETAPIEAAAHPASETVVAQKTTETSATFSHPDKALNLDKPEAKPTIEPAISMPPPPPKIVNQAYSQPAIAEPVVAAPITEPVIETAPAPIAEPVAVEPTAEPAKTSDNLWKTDTSNPVADHINTAEQAPAINVETIEVAQEKTAEAIADISPEPAIVETVTEPIQDSISETVESAVVSETSSEPTNVIENAVEQVSSIEENISTATENITQTIAPEEISEQTAEATSSLADELGIDHIEDDITAEAIDNLEVSAEPVSDNSTEFTLPPMEAGELAGTTSAATAAPTPADEGPLQTLIREHQQWLDSNGAEGRRAVFREDIISAGADLSHQRLSGASFRGLNIARCKFTQAQLNEADFGDCNLEGADFTAAILDSANFQQAHASGTAFSAAQMPKADFGGAQLQNCNFTQAKMQEANFRDANLGGSNMQQITANLANFRNASLDNTNLTNADLTQAILREANLSHSDMKDANLVQTNLKDASMHKVDLNSTDFSQALDISSEVQAQFMQVERANLHNEMQKLNGIRDELEQRERALISEREQLQRQLQAEKTQQQTQQLPDIDGVSSKLKKSGRLFLAFGIGWLILCFLLAIILQSVFAQLDNNQLSLVEMLLMGVLMLVPLIFFVVSMAKSFSLSHSLQKLSPRDPNDPL